MRPLASMLVLALAALALAGPLAGCGGGERTFEAEELVAEANEAGAQLELGELLSESEEGEPTYAVRFAAGGDREEAPADAHAHGAGSLTIADSVERGRAEYERCEQAVTLLCFRASNAVLVFEGDYTPEDAERVTIAIRRLAGHDD